MSYQMKKAARTGLSAAFQIQNRKRPLKSGNPRLFSRNKTSDAAWATSRYARDDGSQIFRLCFERTAT